MEAMPEFLRLFQDTIFRTNLDIADHFPGKMFIDKWTYCGTGATIETIKGRINTELVQLFSKSWVNNRHSFSSW